jgi:hypothetical protein
MLNPVDSLSATLSSPLCCHTGCARDGPTDGGPTSDGEFCLGASIFYIGFYSLIGAIAYAYRNRWRVGLKFYFVVTAIVAVMIVAWLNGENF